MFYSYIENHGYFHTFGRYGCSQFLQPAVYLIICKMRIIFVLNNVVSYTAIVLSDLFVWAIVTFWIFIVTGWYRYIFICLYNSGKQVLYRWYPEENYPVINPFRYCGIIRMNIVILSIPRKI